MIKRVWWLYVEYVVVTVADGKRSIFTVERSAQCKLPHCCLYHCVWLSLSTVPSRRFLKLVHRSHIIIIFFLSPTISLYSWIIGSGIFCQFKDPLTKFATKVWLVDIVIRITSCRWLWTQIRDWLTWQVHLASGLWWLIYPALTISPNSDSWVV